MTAAVGTGVAAIGALALVASLAGLSACSSGGSCGAGAGAGKDEAYFSTPVAVDGGVAFLPDGAPVAEVDPTLAIPFSVGGGNCASYCPTDRVTPSKCDVDNGRDSPCVGCPVPAPPYWKLVCFKHVSDCPL
jgi:hypothetical protein